MPISEDEYDHKPQHHGMSKAEQRRSNKPIMEKRRRARINHCLNELKALILDAMKKDPARHSKLEKADILEMTVKHLQTIQRQQLAVAVATDPTVLHKFKTGFNECASEVSRYISRIEGVEPAVKQRLVAHLSSCVSGLQQLSPFTFGGSTAISSTIGSVFPTMGVSTALHLPLQQGPNTPSSTTNLQTILPQIPTGDVNNNHHNSGTRLQMTGGLQLIPSRLPTGELALLLPHSGQLPGNVLPFFPPLAATQGTTSTTSTTFAATSALINTENVGPSSTVTSGSIDRSHPSAFTAVARSQSPTPAQNPSKSPSCLPHDACSSRVRSGSPPLLSPTSSVSSCDTTDTYPSPNTPPPPSVQPSLVNSQHIQNQTQPYPTTVNTNQFKIPLGSPSSGFKVFQFPGTETLKPPASPQQQPLVTSTSSPAVDAPGKLKLPLQTTDSMSSTGILGTVTEVKFAFKTVPVPAEESLSAIPTASVFPTVSSSNPTFRHSLPVTLSTPVDQCLSVVTAIPGTTTFVEGHHIAVTKNPPLDFSVKKEDFHSTSTQTPTSNKRQLPASFGASECPSDLVSHSFPSPDKMLRLSFNVQNEVLHKSNTNTGTQGLLKCSESKSHLSVVVEDLSNKPSTSTDAVTTTSAAQTGNKDMWRPW
ncbi:Protein deadpan [Cryptotermes secundus]|uniref:Protein deadpan n=2 Tax=Cryptotermes secundus TaxID=105785 RepID=A0A2J7R4D2_9NEOP|nr:mucin-5AC [Cryptotermes secundus]PNF35675.1 Protein deadpan [Cryptotermes secundus]